MTCTRASIKNMQSSTCSRTHNPYLSSKILQTQQNLNCKVLESNLKSKIISEAKALICFIVSLYHQWKIGKSEK